MKLAQRHPRAFWMVQTWGAYLPRVYRTRAEARKAAKRMYLFDFSVVKLVVAT